MRRYLAVFVLSLAVGGLHASAQDKVSTLLPAGAKVFIAPMEDDFRDYLVDALRAKKVPLTIVDDKSQARFEISGHSESHAASTAQKLILQNFHSSEQASIQVTDLESSVVVFAYSANKGSSAHGKQSTAEACASHIKDKIASRK